ncbi:MAG: hypothetical protein FJZ00_09170, partial [Candidatus Sericytochromatia bacterium]|nr:hypothetical protein [Candidatus Tanganyikabacteria bacterium]
VGDVDAVLQLGAPATVASYLQRMGRSGRRGSPGYMVVLAGDREGFLRAVALTELARRRWVEPVRLDDRDWAVYVHQILALLLARRVLSPDEIYRALKGCSAFKGIRHAEFAQVVDQLVVSGHLERTGAERIGQSAARLRLGFATERDFGARNFAALRSVFEGGVAQMTVYSNGQAVGTVDRGFAARLKAGREFTLAGQNWRPERIDWDSARIDVAAGEAGGMPAWRGGLATPMAGEVALEIRKILISSEYPSYLDAPEQAYLDELRAEAADKGLEGGLVPIQGSATRGDGRSKRLTLWTLAGERINRAIGLLLEDLLDAESHADWEDVRLVARAPGAKLDPAELSWHVEGLTTSGITPLTRRAALMRMPASGGSRFLRLLPGELAAEARAAGWLDFAGLAAFLECHRLAPAPSSVSK